MRSKLLFGALALGATVFISGCVAGAGVYGQADAPVAFSEEPTLVVVEPDVWVVRDYDQAVYYVDGYYWVYRSDVWYRSPTYESGWTTVQVNVVPRLIVSRDHHAYVHYHGAAGAQTRKAPRERAAGAPDDRARSEHAEDRHVGPPGQDKGARPPERADDRRAGPPPGPAVNPRDGKVQNEGKRDNVKEERKADDKKAPGKKDDKKKADKK
jgi:hypothetical protein